MKPPQRVFILPGAAGFGSKNSCRLKRSAGTSRIASTPLRSNCQKARGLMAPGNRQADPDDRNRFGICLAIPTRLGR